MVQRVLLLVVLCVGLVGLAGCSGPTYEYSDLMPPQITQLESNQDVLIIQPEPAVFEGRVYENSPSMVTSTLKGMLSPAAKQIHIIPMQYGILDGQVKLPDVAYVFYPETVLWEQRAAGWSGKAAKATINLHIYTSKNGKLGKIYSRELKGVGYNHTSQHLDEIMTPLFYDTLTELYPDVTFPETKMQKFRREQKERRANPNKTS